jgi:hypothetical protein
MAAHGGGQPNFPMFYALMCMPCMHEQEEVRGVRMIVLCDFTR